MTPEAARIIAKNKALGLPAHGFRYLHDTVAETDLATRRAEIKRIADGRRGA